MELVLLLLNVVVSCSEEFQSFAEVVLVEHDILHWVLNCLDVSHSQGSADFVIQLECNNEQVNT